jgi:hypothetical protein
MKSTIRQLTADDFRNVLKAQLREAQQSGHGCVEISSGDLHRGIGGYPGRNHRMPVCCSVMRQQMKVGDAILEQPPKGNGANPVVRYYLEAG